MLILRKKSLYRRPSIKLLRSNNRLLPVMCKVCNPTIGNLKWTKEKLLMEVVINIIPMPVTFKCIMTKTKKIMKSRLLNVGLIACALLMTLSGCSTDETATDGKGTEAQSMKIVSEGNFTSADNSAAKTRATDTESGTSFTSGDAIAYSCCQV